MRGSARMHELMHEVQKVQCTERRELHELHDDSIGVVHSCSAVSPAACSRSGEAGGCGRSALSARLKTGSPPIPGKTRRPNALRAKICTLWQSDSPTRSRACARRRHRTVGHPPRAWSTGDRCDTQSRAWPTGLRILTPQRARAREGSNTTAWPPNSTPEKARRHPLQVHA